MGTETWQGLLATVATVFGIISGIAGVVFGIIQYRGKVAEGERANLAEQATERMAAELTAARAELSRSSQAQERLAEDEAAVLVRLRRNGCFYFDPPQPVKIGPGRPSSHGAKFVCNDFSTWLRPPLNTTKTTKVTGVCVFAPSTTFMRERRTIPDEAPERPSR